MTVEDGPPRPSGLLLGLLLVSRNILAKRGTPVFPYSALDESAFSA